MASVPERKRAQGFGWVFRLITLKGLIFTGFWAQRPYYIRLLGYFDAKGNNGLASQRGSSDHAMICAVCPGSLLGALRKNSPIVIITA